MLMIITNKLAMMDNKLRLLLSNLLSKQLIKRVYLSKKIFHLLNQSHNHNHKHRLYKIYKLDKDLK